MASGTTNDTSVKHGNQQLRKSFKNEINNSRVQIFCDPYISNKIAPTKKAAVARIHSEFTMSTIVQIIFFTLVSNECSKIEQCKLVKETSEPKCTRKDTIIAHMVDQKLKPHEDSPNQIAQKGLVTIWQYTGERGVLRRVVSSLSLRGYLPTLETLLTT